MLTVALLMTASHSEGRADAFISTDCGAVQNTMGAPLNLATKEEAAAAIINGGTDLEQGTAIFNSSMLSAVSKGLVTEATITVAARRNLMQRFVQGDFDPVVSSAAATNKTVEWSNIQTSVVNSTEHQAITYAGDPFLPRKLPRICSRTLNRWVASSSLRRRDEASEQCRRRDEATHQ